MRTTVVDWTKLLTTEFNANPVLNNLMVAASNVVNDVITKPRHTLGAIKEQYKYTKGDPYIFDKDEDETGLVFMGELPSDATKVVGRIKQIEHIEPVRGQPRADKMTIEYDIALANSQVETRTKVLEVDTRINRQWLVRNSSALGFDFPSDVLTDEDYYRIYRFISEYYPGRGTSNGLRFIGYLLNLRTRIFPLFSDGLGLFTRSAEEAASRHLFKTSHVEIEYDLSGAGVPQLKEMTQLFYYLAPIELVLRRIVAIPQVADIHPIHSGGGAFSHEYFSSRAYA